MTGWQKFKYELFLFFRYEIIGGLRNLKRRIWNKRLKLWWNRLYFREDEFHSSLDMDVDALSVMDEAEQEKYHNDLCQRRLKAHIRDLSD